MEKILINIAHPQLPAMINHRQLCLECDIAELSLYYGKCYSLPFCEYLDITYVRNSSDNIAERLKVEKNIFDRFSKYGAKLVKKTVSDRKKYHSYLKRALKNGEPVIVHLDCFYVPWDQGYGSYHNNHTLIIAGISDDGYFASDPYFGKQGWIPAAEFFKGSKYFFEFNTETLPLRDAKPHLKCLITKVKEMEETGYFEQLEQFSEDLRIAKLNDETAEKITRAMGIVELNKQRVLMFLHEWDTLEGHHCYTSLYSKVWSNWQVLKVMSLRAKYRKYDKASLIRLSDYLIHTRVAEENVLLKIMEREATESTDGINEKKNCLDMRRYCNNKGLTESTADDVADCTGFGEYICIKDRKQEIQERGYELLAEERADNILCQGQEIDLTVSEEDIGITLLMTAEWGDYEREFGFVYLDGVIETEKVLIKDWSISDEKRIIIGSSYLIEGGNSKKFRENVYADEITVTFGENKHLKKIVLPDCSNIHILAIRRNKKGDNND